MSGHSKWSTIKHKKAAKDQKRGKAFSKLVKEITVAARLGGGDPDGNPRLRAALSEAKASSVPSDNIDRAIKKGAGEIEGAVLEEIVYEGYGPGGAAVLIEAMTDNKNRTVQEIRHLFDRHGGNLAANGAVAWTFSRRGYLAIERSVLDEEAFMELALELGVDDVNVGEDAYEIVTTAEQFHLTREALEQRKLPLAAQEVLFVPHSHVALTGPKALQMERLLEALEEHDDVQKVWANSELPAEPAAR